VKTLNETACWIGLIGTIEVLHLSEQLLFGLDGLATLKQILAGYHRPLLNSLTFMIPHLWICQQISPGESGSLG
jgi:hypothetical protein